MSLENESCEVREGADVPAVAGAPPLPCLRSNNSTGENKNPDSVPIAKSAFKTEFCLKTNIELAVQYYGIEHLAFFTLTFSKPVYCPKLAQKRLNSLLTHVIRSRYGNRYIAVFERHASGGIHFHFVVYLKNDIRTGFDWDQAKQAYFAQESRDYKLANKLWTGSIAHAENGKFLAEEWRFWRELKKRYRWLGRCEMLPIRSTAEAVARYTGGYIAKHMQNRKPEDKGVQLVRYGKGMHWARSQIAFNSPKNWLWREKLKRFAFYHGCDSLDSLKNRFGSQWAYHCAPAIEAMPLLVRLGDRVFDAAYYEPKSAQMICRMLPKAGGLPTIPPKKINYSRPELELRLKLKVESALNSDKEIALQD